MIHPILERIYLLIFVVVYFSLRKRYSIKSDEKSSSLGLYVVELYLFFSIFDNFVALEVFGVNIKLPFTFLVASYLLFFKRTLSLKYKFAELAFLSFFVIQLISFLWIDYYVSAHVKFVFLFLVLLVFLILFELTNIEQRNVETFIYNLTRIGLISASIGVIEFIIQILFSVKIPYPIVSRSLETSEGLLARAFGAMFEPNWYGISLIMYFLIFLHFSQRQRKFEVFLFMFALLVTGNKITTLILLVLLAKKYLLGHVVKNFAKIGFALIALIFLLISGLLDDILLDRFHVTIIAFTDNSFAQIFASYDRFAYIYYLWIGFLEAPFFGHGLNSALIVKNQIPWLQLPIDEIKPMMTVQSGIFRVLFEQGIIGIFILISGFYWMFRQFREKKFFLDFIWIFSLLALFNDIWNGLYSIPILLLIPALYRVRVNDESKV